MTIDRSRFDLLVVGAGFAGSVVAERAASQLGWRVLVVEHRDHVGGNAADFIDAHGVRVHRYGPHIFHTNSDLVWSYVSRFTGWLPYRHKVLAKLDEGLIPIPFNLNSIDLVFAPDKAKSLRESLVSRYGEGSEVSVFTLRESDDAAMRELAAFLYERLYSLYNLKQWGRPPEDMDPSVAGRLPIRISHDDNYFLDKHQGIPADGYTALFERMLANPKIEVVLGADYHDMSAGIVAKRVVYTGPIDRYFDYRFGELPYRTLRFDLRHHPCDLVQPVSVITYPNGEAFTRSTEFKHFTSQEVKGTTISFEYPEAHRPGETMPYYPMPFPESRQRYQQYSDAAKALKNVYFCGRLGRYQYLNMDQAIGQALSVFKRLEATV